MKTQKTTIGSANACSGSRQRHNRRSHPGFALVVTLSLMILLTVIAVGLLTLSSLSIRSSSLNRSIATARANTRMALMLAIGDFQKSAGPDQRITARADIVDEMTANPRLTGVWRSRTITATIPPAPSDYDQAARNDHFVA